MGNITGDFVNNYIRLEGDSALYSAVPFIIFESFRGKHKRQSFVNIHMEASRAPGGAGRSNPCKNR